MKNTLYTVLLLFDPDDQPLRQKIIDRLAQVDPKASERLGNIRHHRIIIKKNATLKNAQKIANLLQQAGATCKIHEQPETRPQSPSKASEQVSPAVQEEDPALIMCPKCHRQQPPADECQACGVIIKKARPHQNNAPPRTQVPPQEAEIPFQYITIPRVKQRFAAAFRALIKFRPIDTEKLQDWWQRLVDRVLSCVVVVAIGMALEMGLLYLFKMLWYIYTATVVGSYYINSFPEKAAAIQQLVNANALRLCWDSILVVICVSLLISIAAQLLHLIRYFFDTMGIVGKLILWFAPATALAAWQLQQLYQFPYYLPTIFLVLVPTICVFSAFMQLARDTMPEIGMLWSNAAKAIWKSDTPLWIKIKQIIRTGIDSLS